MKEIAVAKRLVGVFMFFYLAVIVYLILFFLVPDVQDAIIGFRNNIGFITKGDNYYWALLIALVICFLGSASIGFPVPFPFVLFSLSTSVYSRYQKIFNDSLNLILGSGSFWLEIMGLAIAGGLGCALGEFSGYAVGYGSKKVAEERHSGVLSNIDGFGKVVLQNEKRIPFYVFIFALTPLPDDILFVPLGMLKYPAWKCIIPGWLGKNFTTIFYCLWPILVELGFLASGYTLNDRSSIITEAIMLLIVITIMFFILSFNWNRYLQKRDEKKGKKKMGDTFEEKSEEEAEKELEN